MEPCLRGEEICHPPQFPVPEVRLPIGAVGRMGTGSSTDLTVAGSPRLPSFSERSYGEQFRCRHFPREHMGNSSVAVIFRENIWEAAPLPAGLFSFFGGATIWAYRGALRWACVWYGYGIDTVRRGRAARCRMGSHGEQDGGLSVERCGAVSAVMRANVCSASCAVRTGTHIRAATSARTCCRRRRYARALGLTAFFDFFRAVYRSVRSVQNTNKNDSL